MTRAATDNVTRMRELYEAFGRGDVPTVLGAMDERIEWYEAEGNPYDQGRPFIGPQEVLDNVLLRLARDFDGFSVVPDRFLGDGDTVVMQGRYRATRAHATGRPLDAQVVHIWDLRDGRIARFQQHVDTRQFAAVLGAPPG